MTSIKSQWVAAFAVAAAAAGVPLAAQARGPEVGFSVHISQPGVSGQIDIGRVPPRVVGYPAYPSYPAYPATYPAYPAYPVYQTYPRVIVPPPVVVAPAPVYRVYPPYRVYDDRGFKHRHWRHKHWRDHHHRDRDWHGRDDGYRRHRDRDD